VGQGSGDPPKKRNYGNGGLAFDQPGPDNQSKAEHGESGFATCLDEGSNPSNSTNNYKIKPVFIKDTGLFAFLVLKHY